MGDAYQGFRYVATTPSYFAAISVAAQRPFTVAPAGSFDDDRPARRAYETVLGRRGGAADGLAHRRSVLRRRGDGRVSADRGRHPACRPGSADDRSIFLSLPSYWEHERDRPRGMAIKPLTAVLVRPKRMSDLPALHRRAQRRGGDAGRLPQRGAPRRLQPARRGRGDADRDPRHRGDRRAALPLRLDVQRHAGRAGARSRPCARWAPGVPPSSRIVLLESRGHRRRRRRRRDCSAGHGAGVPGRALSRRRRAGPVAGPLPSSLFEPAVAGRCRASSARWPGCCPRVLAYRMEVAENLAPLS